MYSCFSEAFALLLRQSLVDRYEYFEPSSIYLIKPGVFEFTANLGIVLRKSWYISPTQESLISWNSFSCYFTLRHFYSVASVMLSFVIFFTDLKVYYCHFICEFFTPVLSDSFSQGFGSQQVSSSLKDSFCILADLNVVVWMVSNLSKSSSLRSN